MSHYVNQRWFIISATQGTHVSEDLMSKICITTILFLPFGLSDQGVFLLPVSVCLSICLYIFSNTNLTAQIQTWHENMLAWVGLLANQMPKLLIWSALWRGIVLVPGHCSSASCSVCNILASSSIQKPVTKTQKKLHGNNRWVALFSVSKFSQICSTDFQQYQLSLEDHVWIDDLIIMKFITFCRQHFQTYFFQWKCLNFN